MKVGMTGVTSFQCNIQRPVNHLYSGASALYYALKDENGADAVYNGTPWDILKLGVRSFDVIFCGLYTISSLVSGGAESSALVINEAVSKGVPIVFYVDDWHLPGIASCYKTMGDPVRRYQVERHARLMTKDGEHLATILQHIAAVQNAYRMISKGSLPSQPFKVLFPSFPWCMSGLKHNILKMFGWGEDSVVLYDPTNLFPKVENTYQGKQKAREWVLSSRYDQSKFVNHLQSIGMRWPVKSYGCRKNGDELLRNELDLVSQAYAPRWGVLSHTYPSILQGQWRNRFMFASFANSIIFCEGAEAHPALMHGYSIHEIENFSDTELQSYAEFQRLWLAEAAWSRDLSISVIDDTIKDVRRIA